jgi:hypothetical protein
MYKIHRIVQERYLRMIFSGFVYLVNLVNPAEIIRKLVREEGSLDKIYMIHRMV